MDFFQGWVTTTSAWLRFAKEKTYTTFELVKKDLAEFSNVITCEASALASVTVESVKQQAYNLHQIVGLEDKNDKQNKEESKKMESKASETEQSSSASIGWIPKLYSVPILTNNLWIKAIFDTVKNIAQENTVEGEDEFTERIYSQMKSTSRSNLPHYILYEIQANPETYMTIPEGDKELFKMWCDDFNLTEYNGRINALLTNCLRMRALYQEMLEALYNGDDLLSEGKWDCSFILDGKALTKRQTYFYKVHQMEFLVLCKANAEKQLMQHNGKETTQGQDRMVDSGKKNCIQRRLKVRIVELDDQQWRKAGACVPVQMLACSHRHITLYLILRELHDEGSRTSKTDSNSSSNTNDGWINWDE